MPRDEKLEHLKRVPLFARMGHRELERLGQLADEIEVGLDQVLTEQGRIGHEFFFVIDGHLVVLDGNRPIANLGPGDFFGEIALIYENARRTATVTASSPLRFFVLTRQSFRSLLEHQPEIEEKVMAALEDRLQSGS